MKKLSTTISRAIFLLLFCFPIYATTNLLQTILIGTSEKQDQNTFQFAKHTTPTASTNYDNVDLQASVITTNPTVNVGENAVFYFTITNNSKVDATGVIASVPIPAAMSFVDYGVGTGSWDQGTGIWKIDEILAGTSVEMKYSVDIKAECATASIEVIAANEPDSDSTPNNHIASEDDQASLAVAPSKEGCKTIISGDKDLDLSVKKIVTDPLAPAGSTVVYYIGVTNNGPIDASNVVINDLLPAGVTFIASSYGSGGMNYDAVTGDWTIATIPSGGIAEMKIEVTVGKECPITNTATLVSLDQNDTDPSNNSSSAVINNCGSTGGGSGGFESNGNMASKIAQRNFRNMENAANGFLPATPEFDAAFKMSAAANKHSALASLMEVIPQTGPLNSNGIVTTPNDIVGLTNATSAFSVDYVNADKNRLAVVLATTTPDAFTYEHTKVVCDRLNGASLESIRKVRIQDRNFLMTELRHPNGHTDYAVSFVVYDENNRFVIDSQFRREQYKTLQTGNEVMNFQVWSAVPQFTEEMVAQILISLAKKGIVENAPTQVATVPSLYIKSGRFEQGKLFLNIVNNAQASSINLNGTMARTEKEDRTAFTKTIALPATKTANLEIPVGNLFDLGFSITTTSNTDSDELYVADGSWGTSTKEANITAFKVMPSTAQNTTNSYVLDRDIEIAGSVKNSVAIFRFIQAGASATNLRNFDGLRFTAKGTGTVKVVLEKAGITSWDQYSASITLNPDGKIVNLPFSAFRRSNGDAGLTADDLTQVVFYINGNGSTETAFSMNISNMGFVKSSSFVATEGNEQPKAIELAQNFPNPFNPSTSIQFNMPSAGSVKVTVFDMMGRSIATLANGNFGAGAHTLQFDATNLPSGTYFYRLEANGQNVTKKMTLLK